MTLTRRKPSGQPSWPTILLAGPYKAGKSWVAAEATGSERFGTSIWIEIGEGTAEEYGDGNVPGSDYEIFGHDGSFTEILASVRAAVAEPQIDGKPNLLVVDSMTELWDLLSDEQQTIANRKRTGKNGQEANITPDQWTAAKKRWGYILAEFRKFPGPVIVTCRLEEVAVFGANGQPNGETMWKIKAEKNFPFTTQVVMQARYPRQWVLTAIQNTKLQLPDGGMMKWPQFTIDDLLSKMGLENVRPSSFVELNSARAVGEADRARQVLMEVLESKGIKPPDATARFAATGYGDLRTSDDAVAIAELVAYYENLESVILS